MIRLALAALLAALATVAAAQQTTTILRVLDGDTYTIAAPWLPPELGQTISIRVLGIDTPEHGARAKCQDEAALADKATRFATDKLRAAASVAVQFHGWDKYGGRIDGDVMVDGVSIGTLLIAAGLARPYDGGTKSSWCGG